MSENGKTLYLPLKKEWYDMIENDEKKEEYREIKKFWTSRLCDGNKFKHFEYVCFSYGYTKRRMMFRIEEIVVSCGNPKWGAENGKEYYVIRIGERVNG